MLLLFNLSYRVGIIKIIFYLRFYRIWQGWIYRLVIDNRYFIRCFSAIDYRRCFAFNFFYRLSPFLCFLLTFYRLVESLNSIFVLVESDKANIVSFLVCYTALYNTILKVYFLILDSTGKNSFSTYKFHSIVNTAKILVHSHDK